jgi:hypothetical protein
MAITIFALPIQHVHVLLSLFRVKLEHPIRNRTAFLETNRDGKETIKLSLTVNIQVPEGKLIAAVNRTE